MPLAEFEKRKQLAGKVMMIIDFTRNIEENAEVEIITIDSNKGVELQRHSAATYFSATRVKDCMVIIILGVAACSLE